MHIAGAQRRTRLMYALGHEVIYAFLAVAGASFATHFDATGASGLRTTSLVGAAFFGLLFLGSWFRNRRW